MSESLHGIFGSADSLFALRRPQAGRHTPDAFDEGPVCQRLRPAAEVRSMRCQRGVGVATDGRAGSEHARARPRAGPRRGERSHLLAPGIGRSELGRLGRGAAVILLCRARARRRVVKKSAAGQRGNAKQHPAHRLHQSVRGAAAGAGCSRSRGVGCANAS